MSPDPPKEDAPVRHPPASIARRFLAVLTVVLLACLPVIPAAAEDTVVFIHDTHLHGRFNNPGIFTADNDPGNRPDTTIAKYFGLVEQIRQRRGGDSYTRVLGSGDDPLKYLLGWEYRGDHMIDALNAGGLDYNTFGNHEFDAGPANVRRLVQDSAFTWVSANVLNHTDSEVFAKPEGARKYVIEDINGVRVGFTGYAHDTAPDITIMGHRVQPLQQVDVLDPVQALPGVVSDMQDSGAQLIVVMSHANPEDHRRVARNVGGIDLIVGDHAESEAALCDRVPGTPECTPEYVNGTVIVTIEADLEYLAESRFTLDASGTITDTRILRHDLADDVDAVTGETYPVSPAVKTVQDTYLPPYYDQYEDTVGRTSVPFDLRNSTLQTGESAAGDFYADATRAVFDSDLSFHVPLLLWSDTRYPPGDLHHLDMYRSFAGAAGFEPENVFFPPVDLVANVEMTGDSVSQLFQLALASPTPNAFFPLVSGAWLAFHPGETDPARRVSHIYVNGEPLDPSATYRMATTAILTRPKAIQIETGIAVPPTLEKTLGVARILNTRLVTEPEILVDKIRRESPIRPSVVGRVSVVTDTLPSDAGGTVTVTNADLGRGAAEAADTFTLSLSVGGGVPAGADTFSVLALGPTHPQTVDTGNRLSDAELLLLNQKRDTNFQVVVNLEPRDTTAVRPDSVAITLDVNRADTAGYDGFRPAVYEPGRGWVPIEEGRVLRRDGARITFRPPHFSSFAIVNEGGGSGGGGSCAVQRLGVPEPVSHGMRWVRDWALSTGPGRWLTDRYYEVSRRIPRNF